MLFFKKIQGLASKAKDKYASYEKKKAFNMQISAEKRARELEQRAAYNKQLNKRLERQIKAQKVLDKTAKLQQKLQPKQKETQQYNPFGTSSSFSFGSYGQTTTKKKQQSKPFNPFNPY